MRRNAVTGLVIFGLTLSGFAHAQNAAAGKTDKKQASEKAEPSGTPAKKGNTGEVPKDPNGVTGISPFWEAVSAGDALFVAQDVDGAIAKYREALKDEPRNPVGHYRLGEAFRAKGDFEEAGKAFDAALRFAPAGAPIRAQVLFSKADLEERKKNLDQADRGWDDYIRFANAQPKVTTYKASAEERKKRIATWKEMVEQYSKVKERIKKREAELAEDAKKKK